VVIQQQGVGGIKTGILLPNFLDFFQKERLYGNNKTQYIIYSNNLLKNYVVEPPTFAGEMKEVRG